MVSAVFKCDTVTTRPKQDKQNISTMSLSLFLHLFSFLEKDEIANSARISVTFCHSSKKYTTMMMENRLVIWTKLFTGKPTQILISTKPKRLTTNLDSISFQDENDLHFISVNGETRGEMSYDGSQMIGGPVDERVSVYAKYWNNKTEVMVFDNLLQRQSCKLKFSDLDRFKAVFGTDKRNQRLELMTSKGDMFLVNPALTKNDRNPIVNRICCLPNFSPSLTLENAYKVKNSYYFHWFFPEKYTSVITFMKDKEFPKDHIVLSEENLLGEDLFADDDFFYRVKNMRVIIFKAGRVWKSFELFNDDESISFQKIVLHRSNYAFIIERRVTYQKTKINQSFAYSINHFNDLKVTVIGETIGDSRGVSKRMFVHKDLLMLNINDDQWSIVHLPTNKQVTILNFPNQEVHQIGGADHKSPVNFVVYHSDPDDNGLSDDPKREGGNKCFDVFAIS